MKTFFNFVTIVIQQHLFNKQKHRMSSVSISDLTTQFTIFYLTILNYRTITMARESQQQEPAACIIKIEFYIMVSLIYL